MQVCLINSFFSSNLTKIYQIQQNYFFVSFDIYLFRGQIDCKWFNWFQTKPEESICELYASKQEGIKIQAGAVTGPHNCVIEGNIFICNFRINQLVTCFVYSLKVKNFTSCKFWLLKNTF